MSDFYQILKREISPVEPTGDIVVSKAELEIKEKAVDKKDKIFSQPPRKKITKKIIAPKQILSGRKKNLSLNLSEKKSETDSFLSLEISNPIWLTMSETAKLGGIQKRTVKRALRAGSIKYRIVESRYQVDLRSALIYLFSKKKLWNKVKEFGIGQYVEKWKK